MAIQLCPVDTANVHPRNILGSSSSFDRERLSPFGSLSSRCWETVVYITLSSGPAQPGGQPCQKGDAFQLPKDRSRTRATYWVRLIKPWLSALVAPDGYSIIMTKRFERAGMHYWGAVAKR